MRLFRISSRQTGSIRCAPEAKGVLQWLERLTTFTCWICGKTIPLKECDTTDAIGHPVHQDCYAKFMKQDNVKRKAADGS